MYGVQVSHVGLKIRPFVGVCPWVDTPLLFDPTHGLQSFAQVTWRGLEVRDGEGLRVLAQNIPVPPGNSAKFRRPNRIRGWRVRVMFHDTHPGTLLACEMCRQGNRHGSRGPALSHALDVTLHDVGDRKSVV